MKKNLIKNLFHFHLIMYQLLFIKTALVITSIEMNSANTS